MAAPAPVAGTHPSAQAPSQPAPPAVAAITISPPVPSLRAGETIQLSATVTDAAGHMLRDRRVRWASTEANVASVSAAGKLRAAAPGEAIVSATAGGMTRSIQVTVTASAPTPPAAATVEVIPASLTLAVGATAQLRVTVRDSGRVPLADRPVHWRSGDIQVAEVSTDGLVIAKGPGTAQITALSEGHTAGVMVSVTAPIAAKPPAVPADPAPAVRQLIDQYAEAIAAKSLERITGLYPSISTTSRRDWERLFHDYDAVSATLVGGTVNISTSGQSAGFDLALTLTRGREEQRIVLASQAALQFENGAYRFLRIEQTFSRH
jgi:hypothetical protein